MKTERRFIPCMAFKLMFGGPSFLSFLNKVNGLR